ncbi:peptidoglycan DD-metalloendopeptidase family protein [Plantibacter sp. YIM 135249]|uniref:M23 family metallopeptidase n=1 Tax=Plantibacter sp. YIM 135249 TaxID=3423918 RepID=UPI003D344894
MTAAENTEPTVVEAPPLSRRELRERERAAAASAIAQPLLSTWQRTSPAPTLGQEQQGQEGSNAQPATAAIPILSAPAPEPLDAADESDAAPAVNTPAVEAPEAQAPEAPADETRADEIVETLTIDGLVAAPADEAPAAEPAADAAPATEAPVSRAASATPQTNPELFVHYPEPAPQVQPSFDEVLAAMGVPVAAEPVTPDTELPFARLLQDAPEATDESSDDEPSDDDIDASAADAQPASRRERRSPDAAKRASARGARGAQGAPKKAPKAPKQTRPAKTSAPASASTAVAVAKPSASRGKPVRKGATKIFAAAAMGFVALMAVATSLPANALLTAEDVAAATVTAQQIGGDGDGQSNKAKSQSVESEGSAELTFTRDDYSTSTIEEAAAAMGIRPANTFTNDPNGTIQWPFAVGVKIGDRFGARDCAGCSSDHHGQDFNPGDGAPIQVIADGVVRHVEDGEGSLGVNIIVDHTINGKLVSSVYAHMQHGSTKVVEGQAIKVGTIIGLTGSTGMSTGPHLHFEIRLDGVTWVDPLEWLYANVN